MSVNCLYINQGPPESVLASALSRLEIVLNQYHNRIHYRPIAYNAKLTKTFHDEFKMEGITTSLFMAMWQFMVMFLCNVMPLFVRYDDGREMGNEDVMGCTANNLIYSIGTCNQADWLRSGFSWHRYSIPSNVKIIILRWNLRLKTNCLVWMSMSSFH